MTQGQRQAVEIPDVIDVADTSIAQLTTIKGVNYPFAARVFGLERYQFAYYSFHLADYSSSSSVVANIYWTCSAATGSVGWDVRCSALNTGVTTRVLDKNFASTNGIVSTSILGPWRYHQTSLLTNNDAVTNASLLTIRVSRDITNKTAAADAYVLGCSLTYTGV